MRLRTQLLIGIVMLVIVVTATVVTTFVTLSLVSRLSEQHDIAVTLQDSAGDLSYLSSQYLLYQEQLQKSRWDAVFASFLSRLDDLEPVGSYDVALKSSIRANAVRLQEVFDEVVAVDAVPGGTDTARQSFLQTAWSRMQVQNRQILFGAVRLEREMDRRLERARLVSTTVRFSLIGLFGVVLLTSYVMMSRRTITGLEALGVATEHVGGGDLDYRIPPGRADEIGDLSRSFNTMAADLNTVTVSKAALEEEVRVRKRAERHTARLLAERSSLFERLQTVLLDVPREYPGIRFSHAYRSATAHAQVGGDFYLVFGAKYGRIGMLIGDVSGHGLEAARIATLVKDSVLAFSQQFGSPHHVLRATNQLLTRLDSSGFVTAFLGLLDPADGTLGYSSAGHPPPLVMNGGGYLSLESVGLPLGAMPSAHYSDAETRLHVGDVVVLYTDGIIEVRRDGEFFGQEGLQRALHRAEGVGVDELPRFILSQTRGFSRGHLHDDAAVLVVEYVGPSLDV